MISVIKRMRESAKAMRAVSDWHQHYFSCHLCQSAHTKVTPTPSGCAEGDRLKAVSDKVGRWLAGQA